MAATSTQFNKPRSVPRQFDQNPTYQNVPPYHRTPHSSSHGFPYMDVPVMQLPIEIPPTSEKTVMASSCSKVQLLYKEIIAKEREYEKWKSPYSDSCRIHEEYGLIAGSADRFNRLQIEGDLFALALKVQNLCQENARGAEYLQERICDIMADVARAIRDDLIFLEKCLDDENKQQKSGKQSESAPSTALSCLRSEYSNLTTRVDQFASMEKTFERSSFTMSSGKRCSLPVSDSSINLRYKLQDIERKLPDSEFVQGVKSFTKGVKDFFSPSPSLQSTYILPSSSDYLREKEKNLEAWVTINRLHDGWRRQINRTGHV